MDFVCQNSASLPSQLYVEPQSRCGVRTEVTWTAPCTLTSSTDVPAPGEMCWEQIWNYTDAVFCSCNHGFTTGTEKSWGLLRETRAPWASVPFPILIQASRADRDQGGYKNHGQTVRPWGYLWIWDSKTALVVKMDPVNSKWIAEGVPRVLQCCLAAPGTRAGLGVRGERGLLCPAPMETGCGHWESALQISQSLTLGNRTAGSVERSWWRVWPCSLVCDSIFKAEVVWGERNKKHPKYVSVNFVNPSKMSIIFIFIVYGIRFIL